jgi:hypothetical protein
MGHQMNGWVHFRRFGLLWVRQLVPLGQLDRAGREPVIQLFRRAGQPFVQSSLHLAE